MLGRRVLWSRDSGPAVVGLLKSSIVLPAWVAGAGRVRQELILGHEEEHLRAHDVQLRFLAALVLFAFPWNPALWIQHRRLGLAVELDCDRRVLERWPRRRRLYGDLLLKVGSGGGTLPSMGVAALAEQPSLLERRIRALLSRAPEVRLAQAAFLGFCAILVVGVALMLPGIVSERAGPEAVEEPGKPIVTGPFLVEELPAPPADAADVPAEPTWTPWDVKPDYRNKEDVLQALVREYPPLLRDAESGARRWSGSSSTSRRGPEDADSGEFGTPGARRGGAAGWAGLGVHPGASRGQGGACVDYPAGHLRVQVIPAPEPGVGQPRPGFDSPLTFVPRLKHYLWVDAGWRSSSAVSSLTG